MGIEITGTPVGTEQAPVVRPIPSGTQTVGGTVTANQGAVGSASWLVQEGLADSALATGSVAAPGAGASIAATASLTAGTYEVEVYSFETATIDVNTLNMRLRRGTTTIVDLHSTAILTPLALRVTVGAETLNIIAIAAAGVGSVYHAGISARRVA